MGAAAKDQTEASSQERERKDLGDRMIPPPLPWSSRKPLRHPKCSPTILPHTPPLTAATTPSRPLSALCKMSSRHNLKGS